MVIELHRQLESQKKEMIQDLSMGLVHGDVKLENILFESERLSAILDFDDFRFSFLLEDLVMTLMHNLHSQSKNMLRAGFYDVFISQFEESFIAGELDKLTYLLKARLVYDCCKYTIAGKKDIVTDILTDSQVEKYILKA